MQSMKVNIALMLTILFWASAFVGIRYGLTVYTPGAMALLRFIVASLCMLLIYTRVKDKKVMPWQDRLPLMLIGVSGIGIYNIALNYGELTVSAGVASFLVGLIPVITALLSVFFLKERLTGMGWLGIAVSMFGLSLLTLGEAQETSFDQGVLFVMIAVLVGAGYHIFSKRFLSRYHPVVVTAWIIWGGTAFLLMFLPALAHELPQADWHATLAIIYMGIFPAAIAYLAWSYVLHHLPASTAAMSLFSLPLLSTAMGFILLHEVPTTLSLLGGLLALFGSFIAGRVR